MKYALTAMFVVCSGCMTQQKADQIVAELPQYMQDNMGTVTVTPFRMAWLLGATGETDIYDPNCPAFVAPWVIDGDRTVRHEAMHSFEFSIYYKDLANGHKESGGQWHRFADAFGNHTYLGYEFGLVAGLFPFALDTPLPGYARAYGAVSRAEDSACVFEDRAWFTWDNEDLRRKRAAVEAFVNGAFAAEPPATPQPVTAGASPQTILSADQ